MRLALALLLLLALPAGASASTISVELADGCQGDAACSKYGGAPPVPITTFAGAPGEANVVSVSREGDVFAVRDDGAVLSAKSPCSSVDAHSARCPVTEGVPGLHGFAAALGDGGDTLAIAGDMRVETELSGGDGTDVIEGSGGNDRIDGGPGADRLLGGAGFDELSYATRTAPVTVDLARETGGEAGEGDGVGGFEVLVGGRGADVLRGAAGDETIDGGAGDDILRGRGGKDDLFGGTGRDRLSGNAGDDRLFGDPAQGDDYYTPIIRLLPDRLDGGAGDDLLSDTGGRNTYLGGPGADVLEGGANADRMFGGAGPDRIRARGGGRDLVRCGAGRDSARTDARDSRRSCERGRTSTAAGVGDGLLAARVALTIGPPPLVRRGNALTLLVRRYTPRP